MGHQQYKTYQRPVTTKKDLNFAEALLFSSTIRPTFRSSNKLKLKQMLQSLIKTLESVF